MKVISFGENNKDYVLRVKKRWYEASLFQQIKDILDIKEFPEVFVDWFYRGDRIIIISKEAQGAIIELLKELDLFDKDSHQGDLNLRILFES